MAASAVLAAGIAQACELTAEDAVVVAATPAARSAAAYMTITNACDGDDRLLGVLTVIAARAELHSQRIEDGIAIMHPIENGIELPSATTTSLEAGGIHVMLLGIDRGLREGELVRLELQFEHAAPLALLAPFRPIKR